MVTLFRRDQPNKIIIRNAHDKEVLRKVGISSKKRFELIGGNVYTAATVSISTKTHKAVIATSIKLSRPHDYEDQ